MGCFSIYGQANFPTRERRRAGSVWLFVWRGELTRLVSLSLFCSFLVGALAFLVVASLLKAFQLYLSIKYTALSLFCFRACPFSLLFIHLPTRPHSFSFPHSLSSTLYPPPLTFSLFFFFRPSPLSFAPSSTPQFPFIHGRHTDRFCNSVSSLRF